MQTVKKFYRVTSLQDHWVRPLNIRARDECMKYNPDSVFEFGCNNGKNLKLMDTRTFGIDINEESLVEANEMGICATFGDEHTIQRMESNSFDVVLTCSVLNHIQEIDEIVIELKRIARKAVISIECNHENTWRWFPHDYQKLGYTKTGEQKSLHRMYDVWVN